MNNTIHNFSAKCLALKLTLLALISAHTALGAICNPFAYAKKTYKKAKAYIDSNKKLKPIVYGAMGGAAGMAIGKGINFLIDKLPKKAQKPAAIGVVVSIVIGYAAYVLRPFLKKRQERIKRRKSYYEILGLKDNADAGEIKRAYRRLAIEWHPDTVKQHHPQVSITEATEKFKNINEAYSMLKPRNQYVKRRVRTKRNKKTTSPIDPIINKDNSNNILLNVY